MSKKTRRVSPTSRDARRAARAAKESPPFKNAPPLPGEPGYRKGKAA